MEYPDRQLAWNLLNMAKGPASRVSSVPSPVGGLNSRDSIADMPPTDAVILDNWWPYPSYVATRKGSELHVSGFAAPVETLVEYLPVSGVPTLFAASGTSFYNVTTAGAVGAAVQTGLTNARWQHAQVTTPGGSFLYMVNGVDSPRLWNGATWTSITGASTPAITGVTPTTLVHVVVFKNRLFFTEINSMNLWYLPVNSVGGAAAKIDLGSVFNLGGSIMAAYTWTIDAGDGADDHLAIISTNGEVAVYSGTDPASASAWGLVGVFTLGRPLGRRCGIKYAGDLVLLTMAGALPMGAALQSSSIDRRVALTDKIQNSISQVANDYKDNYGWQLTLNPDANMLMVNVPVTGGNNFQYAQNTITGAWTKFTGWDANCWLFGFSGLFFGGDTAIYKAWVGDSDNDVPIFSDMLPAFNMFKMPVNNKFFTMVRPFIVTAGENDPLISYRMNVNYDIDAPATPMIWGQMVWGAMQWPGNPAGVRSWRTVGKIGQAGSLRIQCYNNASEIRVNSIDYLMQVGGIL